MFVIKPLRERHESSVPPIVARLVTAEQKNRDTAWIKGVQHAVWTPAMLNPEFAKVRDTRTVNS